MIQKTKQLLFTALAAATLVGSADAATILFVTSAADAGTTGTILTNAGHTVSIYDDATHGWAMNSPAAIVYANSFDLIVQSRLTPFSTIRGQGANWNALETPSINLNPYLVSGQFSASSWRWGTANGSAQGISSGTVLDVLEPADPVLSGVTLTPGTPQTVAITDVNGRVWQLGTAPKAGVTAIAVNSANADQIAIAYAAPGALEAGGGAQYAIIGHSGDSNADIWNAAGEQVLLNAVNTLVPEPGSLALLAAGGLLVTRRRRA